MPFREPRLSLTDILEAITDIEAFTKGGHERAWHDGNGHSHLQATILGPSLTVPIKDGKLFLGTWQQVFHLECDIKPRLRIVAITVIGEP